MEYYDSKDNHKLYSHYFTKNNNMLVHPDVINILDQLGGNIGESNLNLFPDETPYHLVSNGSGIRCNRHTVSNKKNNESTFDHYRDSLISMRSESLPFMMRNPSTFLSPTSKGKPKKKEEIIDEELSKMNAQLDNMKDLQARDENKQHTSFEERRRQKKLNRRDILPKKIINHSRRASKLDEVLLAAVSGTDGQQDSDILKSIMELSEQKVKHNQAVMVKEIEDYIDKNMKEMYSALEELRASFEEEIKSVDEEVFPDVVKGLKEDMESELEILKDQYEEQRSMEIQKIRNRYEKK